MQATSKCDRSGKDGRYSATSGRQSVRDRYYPSMSGVARSHHYYPISDEKAEEGTVNLALIKAYRTEV